MNDDSIKTMLDERKKGLETAIKAIKESAKPVDLNEPIGRLSRMDALQQQQMSLNSKKSLGLSLEQLKGAYLRMENGEYGLCVKCENEITQARLKAKPEVPFCINCQNH